jgi:hypothetical protein
MKTMSKSTGMLAIFCALPLLAAADHDLLSAVQGYYSAPSACSERENDKLVPCTPEIRNCLLIKRVDATHAKISMFRIENNEHSCAIDDAVAVLRGRQILYVDSNSRDINYGAGVSIAIGDKKLIIKPAGVEPSGLLQPYCGSGASLDGLSFDRSSKQPEAGNSCGL